MPPLRIAVIGARRARQGLGPFIARDLAAAGAEVVALHATTERSCAEAARELDRVAGVRPRAYVDPARMLAEEDLDAVAICSPHESHVGLLDLALEHGLHALCEKPLAWGRDMAIEAERCVAAFAAGGKVLFENCQWPYVLPALEELHPGLRENPPARFHMTLEPAASGAAMLADALPHPLSLLQELVPGPARAERCRIARRAADGADVAFFHAGAGAGVDVHVSLLRSDSHPRRFRIEIDGRVAERRVEPRSYALRFADGVRSVPLPDPMTSLIADFVDAAHREDRDSERRGKRIVERARMLEALARAWPDAPEA